MLLIDNHTFLSVDKIISPVPYSLNTRMLSCAAITADDLITELTLNNNRMVLIKLSITTTIKTQF